MRDEEQVVIDDIEVIDGLNDINVDADIDGEEDGSECSDSEDESYMAESGSSDTNGSVDTDFEVEGNEESDVEDLDPQCDDGPRHEVRRPVELVGSASRPFFMLGITFVDKKELMASDWYAVTKGVKLKIAKTD